MSPDDPKEKGPKPPFDEHEQKHPGRESDMETKPDFGEDTYRGFGRMEGRIALVTGADSGIGRAVALAFAREGADVAIAYLNEHDDARRSSTTPRRRARSSRSRRASPRS